MVNVVQHDTRSATRRLVVILASLAVFFFALTTSIIYYVTHNIYVSSYYAISTLFDAVGVDESSVLYSSIVPFTNQFYIVMGISIVDGVVKILVVGFVIASLIDLITAFDIRSKLVELSKRNMKDHFIICGYSMLAERVATELDARGAPFIIVEKDQVRVDMVKESGYVALHEDFTTEATLRNASIDRARAVMFLTENDYENLLGVVTARHINSRVKIIARAEETNAITKIHRAGAELCVVPEVLAGLELGESVVRRRAP